MTNEPFLDLCMKLDCVKAEIGVGKSNAMFSSRMDGNMFAMGLPE